MDTHFNKPLKSTWVEEVWRYLKQMEKVGLTWQKRIPSSFKKNVWNSMKNWSDLIINVSSLGLVSSAKSNNLSWFWKFQNYFSGRSSDGEFRWDEQVGINQNIYPFARSLETLAMRNVLRFQKSPSSSHKTAQFICGISFMSSEKVESKGQEAEDESVRGPSKRKLRRIETNVALVMLQGMRVTIIDWFKTPMGTAVWRLGVRDILCFHQVCHLWILRICIVISAV